MINGRSPVFVTLPETVPAADGIDPAKISALAAADLGIVRQAAEITGDGTLHPTVVFGSEGYLAGSAGVAREEAAMTGGGSRAALVIGSVVRALVVPADEVTAAPSSVPRLGRRPDRVPCRVRGAMDEVARMPSRCHHRAGGAAPLIGLEPAYRPDRGYETRTAGAHAYRRGILRQAGAVHRFRHARLPDHLAGTAAVRNRRRPHRFLRGPRGVYVFGSGTPPMTGGRGVTTVGTRTSPAPAAPGTQRRWVLAITAVASMLVVLDALVVATALTAIKSDLGASVAELEWTVNAYGLSFAVLLMTSAAAGDRWGRRRVFAAGVSVFTGASLLCALAPDAGTLIAGRVLQGAGAAFVMPLTLALLGAAFPPDQRPKALGVFASVSGVAVPLGPLLGGAVVEGVSWPWIFWINVPVGIALVFFALTRIEESRGPDPAIDVPGLVLAGAGSFGVVWGLAQGPTAGWAGAGVAGPLVAGLVAFGAFAAWQRRAAHPMLPLHLFRSRRFAAGNAVIFFHWASALGSVFFMAQFLQEGLGYRPLAAGLALAPWGLTTAVVPQVAGRLVGRFGERPFIVAGLGLHGLAMLWIALVAGPATGYWAIAAPLVLSGTGIAMCLPAAQSAVLTSVAPRFLGKASGAFSAMRQLGGVFGVAVLVVGFSLAGSYASPGAFSHGFTAAVVVSAVLAAAGALAGCLVPRRESEEQDR
ncbi:MFS transporter [Amycolatopsis sp. CA-128772]|uniref:MFS transporter n=1 Tax=Amycolatopsis sp. CA-128772 TaxID=2073159 RepID=UPI001E5CA769|nr:MFS transporter [Amycolatopsis sp. CA-128772]